MLFVVCHKGKRGWMEGRTQEEIDTQRHRHTDIITHFGQTDRRTNIHTGRQIEGETKRQGRINTDRHR